jgi:hypothetical protein
MPLTRPHWLDEEGEKTYREAEELGIDDAYLDGAVDYLLQKAENPAQAHSAPSNEAEASSSDELVLDDEAGLEDQQVRPQCLACFEFS